MTDAVLQSLLLDLRAFPSAFEPAPLEDQATAINGRLDEKHVCKSCGEPACVVYIATSPAHPEAGPRWLDLCAEHARKIRIELDRMEVADDAG